MMNLMYNFINVTDEVITQKSLEKTPSGQSFIDRWTWPRHPEDARQPLRFKRTNTVEEYFYARVVENDTLLGIGALRILWDNDGDFVRETSMEIEHTTLDYQFRSHPHMNNDVTGIIKSKLYQQLQLRLASGRFGRSMCVEPEMHHNCYHEHHETHHKNPACNAPYHRGFDDRGYDYRNHQYPHAPRVNPPVNGPYGGVYNAYHDVDHCQSGKRHD